MTDWIQVEGDYRAGVLSNRQIAERHSVSESGIRKRAKLQGWLKDPTGVKRARVNAAMAVGAHSGAQSGTQSTRCALDAIHEAADEDIEDMERGLRVFRRSLERCEQMVLETEDVREVKVIADAAHVAVAGIRRIRGLDDKDGGGQARVEDVLRQIARRE